MEKKKLYRNIVILAVVLAFILIIVLVLQIVSLAITSRENAELNEKAGILLQQVESLEDEIEYKKSLMFIEKYAREKMALFDEGDILFVPKE